MSTIGIYKIENLINHKIYVGQSRKIEKRWTNHKSSAFNQKEHNYKSPLYRAFRKYGIENFQFSILEECSIEELNQKEIYWINFYNSFFNGYNLTFGGDGSGSAIKKDSVIGTIKDLEITSLTQKEIAKKWNISEEMVQGINTGRYWKHDRKYPIRERKPAKIYYCVDCGKQLQREGTRCIQCYRIFHKKVKDRPSREELKNMIRNYPFTKIGEKYKVTDNAIRKWCDSYNLPRKKAQINKYSDKEWKNI